MRRDLRRVSSSQYVNQCGNLTDALSTHLVFWLCLRCQITKHERKGPFQRIQNIEVTPHTEELGCPEGERMPRILCFSAFIFSSPRLHYTFLRHSIRYKIVNNLIRQSRIKHFWIDEEYGQKLCWLVKRETVEKIERYSGGFSIVLLCWKTWLHWGKLSNSVEKDMGKSREIFSSILRGETEWGGQSAVLSKEMLTT